MNANFIVRDYREDDYEELMKLWNELELASPARGDDRNVISRTLAMGGRMLLLFGNDIPGIVGSSWLTVDGRRTYLHHFGIKKSFQKKGLGKLLLRESLAAATKLGLQVKLEVAGDNIAARELYLKAGFRELENYDVLIMRDLSALKKES